MPFTSRGCAVHTGLAVLIIVLALGSLERRCARAEVARDTLPGTRVGLSPVPSCDRRGAPQRPLEGSPRPAAGLASTTHDTDPRGAVLCGRIIHPRKRLATGDFATESVSPLVDVLVAVSQQRSTAPVEQPAQPPVEHVITLAAEGISPTLTLAVNPEELWVHNATGNVQSVAYAPAVGAANFTTLDLKPGERRKISPLGPFETPERMYWLDRPDQAAWFSAPQRRTRAKTDKSGQFRLEWLRTGSCWVSLWHPQLVRYDTILVNGKQVALDSNRFTVEVVPGVNDLGDIEVLLDANR